MLSLHCGLHEVVHIEQPPEFIPPGESTQGCRLWKTIHALKQSLKAWFGKFSDVLLRFGMRRCLSNHFVFPSHMTEVKYC